MDWLCVRIWNGRLSLCQLASLFIQQYYFWFSENSPCLRLAEFRFDVAALIIRFNGFFVLCFSSLVHCLDPMSRVQTAIFNEFSLSNDHVPDEIETEIAVNAIQWILCFDVN